jgi:3-phenylpropionate/cinnamic acid dioxygenase small subunit
MSLDHEEIRNLTFTYAYCLDEGDFDGVADVLQQATLRPVMAGMRGETFTGRTAIRAFYADQVVTFRDGDPRTRHLINNQLIAVDDRGAAAHARSYFTVLQAPPRLPLSIILSGQYDDSFVKGDDGWHFTEKTIRVDYLNDVSHHFRISTDHRVPRPAAAGALGSD